MHLQSWDARGAHETEASVGGNREHMNLGIQLTLQGILRQLLTHLSRRVSIGDSICGNGGFSAALRTDGGRACMSLTPSIRPKPTACTHAAKGGREVPPAERWHTMLRHGTQRTCRPVHARPENSSSSGPLRRSLRERRTASLNDSWTLPSISCMSRFSSSFIGENGSLRAVAGKVQGSDPANTLSRADSASIPRPWQP